jgi:hypothetical protein
VANRFSAIPSLLPLGPVNVGQAERLMSGILGAVLLGAGLRRGRGGAGLALLGGALLARGVSGHCPVYQAIAPHRQFGEAARQALGNPEHREARSPAVAETVGGPHPAAMPAGPAGETASEVEVASELSFPASDPPSFTPGAA